MNHGSVIRSTPAPVRGKPRLLRSFARRLRDLLAIFGGAVIVYHFTFLVSRIVSSSMSPTLQGTHQSPGDWVLSEKLSYRFRRPRRWELIQFYNDEGMLIVKRVVGLPGETISLQNGTAMINGVEVRPPTKLSFLYYYQFGPYAHSGKQTECGDGYFLLGDDSKDSQDSRFDGPLSPEKIVARPLLIASPRSRFGWVNP